MNKQIIIFAPLQPGVPAAGEVLDVLVRVQAPDRPAKLPLVVDWGKVGNFCNPGWISSPHEHRGYKISVAMTASYVIRHPFPVLSIVVPGAITLFSP